MRNQGYSPSGTGWSVGEADVKSTPRCTTGQTTTTPTGGRRPPGHARPRTDSVPIAWIPTMRLKCDWHTSSTTKQREEKRARRQKYFRSNRGKLRRPWSRGFSGQERKKWGGIRTLLVRKCKSCESSCTWDMSPLSSFYLAPKGDGSWPRLSL